MCRQRRGVCSNILCLAHLSCQPLVRLDIGQALANHVSFCQKGVATGLRALFCHLCSPLDYKRREDNKRSRWASDLAVEGNVPWWYLQRASQTQRSALRKKAIAWLSINASLLQAALITRSDLQIEWKHFVICYNAFVSNSTRLNILGWGKEQGCRQSRIHKSAMMEFVMLVVALHFCSISLSRCFSSKHTCNVRL